MVRMQLRGIKARAESLARAAPASPSATAEVLS
jgi:hypothetical protein